MGEGRSIVIALPQYLPVSDTYTVSVSKNDMRIIAGREKVAEMPLRNREAFDRLSFAHEVGIVESKDGISYPGYITNMAYIEVRNTVQQGRV
jgi:hypothetical protein